MSKIQLNGENILSQTGQKRKQQAIQYYDAALQYIACDLSVMPIVHGGKQPAINKWVDHQISPPDETQIEKWFSAEPRNIAILGGYGRVVWVDFDHAESYHEWAKQYPDIAAKTPTQRTRNGYHVGFKHHPDQPIGCGKLSFNGQHVGDIKGRGGYVVVAPSVHPSGFVYEWLPGQAPWECQFHQIRDLADIGLSEIAESNSHSQGLDSPFLGETTQSKNVFDSEIAKIRQAPVGSRNDTLNRASYTLGGFIAKGQLDKAKVEQG